MKDRDRRPQLKFIIPTVLLLFTVGVGAINYKVALYILSERASESGKEISTDLGFYIFISSFIITIFALLIGVGLAYGIINPLRRLRQAAHAVSQGEMQQADSLMDGPQEISLLGQSFNRLVDYLSSTFQKRDKLLISGLTDSRLILTDARGRIQAMSAQAERLFGVNIDECLGQRIDSLWQKFTPQDKLQQVVHSFLREETTKPAEIVVTDSMDQTYRLGISYSILRDRGGRPLGYLFNLQDLSSINRFGWDIHYVDRLAALGAISAGLAHEIRNPVATIQGIIQMLREEPDSAKRKQYLTHVLSEISRLNHLVVSISEFSEVNNEPARHCDINQLLSEALELCQKSIGNKGNNIKIITNYSQLPQVKLPPHRIVRAFKNIIANAIEFSSPGSYVRITTANEHSNDKVITVEIANSGSYIPEPTRDRIFEPFFTTKPQGTGLGLSIAYQIISSYGGTIRVESDDKETRVVLTIPYSTGRFEQSV